MKGPCLTFSQNAQINHLIPVQIKQSFSVKTNKINGTLPYKEVHKNWDLVFSKFIKCSQRVIIE